MVARLLARRQPALAPAAVGRAGLGAAITIAVLGLLAAALDQPLLAATFGASCALVFTLPSSPLSQPANVVGGHLISALAGLVVLAVAPAAWWSMAIAVGLAVAGMAAARLTHPPAAGTPIVIIGAGASWSYLLLPIGLGALLVVAVGLVFHRLTGTTYPLATD